MMKFKQEPSPKTDWHWFDSKSETSIQSKAELKKIIQPVTLELSPEGHVFQQKWAAIPGATKVEISQADLQFSAHLYPLNLGSVDKKTAPGGKSLDLDLKKDVLLKSLNIASLKSGGEVMANASQLSSQSLKLLCSAKLNGQWVPLYAVSSLGKRGAIPAMLAGASFNQGLLHLPGTVSAREWRLELVTGNKMEDLTPQPIQAGGIHATILQPPTNPKVVGPTGNTLWEQKGPWQGNGFVSVKTPLEQAMLEALASKPTEIQSSYRFTGEAASKVDLYVHQVRGQLIRQHQGVWTHSLQGEAQTMAFDPSLPNEIPASVQADVSLTYLGIRLLHLTSPSNRLVDSVTGHKTMGTIVANTPVVLALPPQIFREGTQTLPPARIGFLGRAASACEIAVRFVDTASKKPMGDPAVLSLQPQPSFRYHWFTFPNQPFPDGLSQLELLTTRGRFYWVGSQPQDLLWAVYDPNPGGRPVLLNGAPVFQMPESKRQLPKQVLPREAFRASHPQLNSDLFLKVEFSDLELRYPR